MLVWILGSMASGKTTLNWKLIDFFSEGKGHKMELKQDAHKGVNFCYSKFPNVISLGHMKRDSATSGIDPVMGDIKVVGVEKSLELALKEDVDCVIMEGAQASSKWFEFVLKNDPKFFLIYLHLDYDDNLNRLKYRQHQKMLKKGELFIQDHRDVKLSNKNYESIIGKNRQYANIFANLGHTTPNALKVDAMQSVEDVFSEVVNFIGERV